jgi:flagellar biosynthetic protein FlhB
MADGQAEDDDKTEDPSQRKLDQAVEKGDVAKSIEVNSWFILAAGTAVVMTSGASMSQDLARGLRGVIEHVHMIPVDGAGLTHLGLQMAVLALTVCALPFLALMIAGIAGNMMQHRMVFSTSQLEPKLDRLSPMAGFKRLFGMEAIVQFLKGLVKLGVISAVIVAVIMGEQHKLEDLVKLDLAAALPITLQLILKMMGAVLAIYFFLAVADYGYQYFRWMKRQRMTMKEVKDEYKETEGSPEVKQKMKQLRAHAAKRRMMNKVPTASVVIMNPTHYAVALHYEQGMPAPICVAKGVDQLALKIREIATENDVPVVENPPLARALHASVQLDQEIPAEHYKAVAEVIGYVLRLKRRAA